MAVTAVTEELLAVSGVRAIHDLHVWALTPSHPLVSVHVAVGKCPTCCSHPMAQPRPVGLSHSAHHPQMPPLTLRQCCRMPRGGCSRSLASLRARCRWNGT